MRRTLAALLFLAALATPAGAVSTTSVVLTTSWTDLGAGPLLLQTNNQSQALFQVGDAAPSNSSTAGFFLQGIGVPQTVSTTSHIYVRARSVTGFQQAAPVVTYAPVSGASGVPNGTSTVQPTQGTITNPTDVSCTANTLCTLSSATSRKYLSIINTSPSGTCRVGYGITPTATRGDPLNSATSAGGQGGTRTFETSFVPNGTIQAICTTASTVAVLEGN